MEAINGLSGEDFIFHDVNDNVYVRKCYGMEALGSKIQEAFEGMAILTTTAAISFDSSPSRENLELQVREAWQLLRHLVPGIACQTSKLPAFEGQYEFRYFVPQSLEDVSIWANQTTFFDDGVAPLLERHEQLKNSRLWSSAEPHYNAELHVSPLKTSLGWQFSLVMPHNSIDGRGAFGLLELFFEFLTSVIEKRAQPTSELKWGEEVARLPPPGPLTISPAEAGLQDLRPDSLKIFASTSSEVKQEATHSPPAIVPWIVSPTAIDNSVQGDIGCIIKFSPEVTATIHATCKKYGRTITQIISALVILANAEASLKIAGQVSEERYKDVSAGFSDSTHFLIAMNSICHRHKLPDGYDSFRSPKSSPLCATDCVELFFPMDSIRKLVKPDTKKSAVREVNRDYFWDGLVNDVAITWKAVDLSLEAYFSRQIGMHTAACAPDASGFDIVCPIVSSIGDLSRLGLLNAYLPSSTRKTLTVEDVIISLGVHKPMFMVMCYQYDSQLSVYFTTAGEFATAESLKLAADIFEEWMMAII
ncbi:hypothetical protein DFH11DRAFT_1134109 [Phellopilus nigrolimitatus]|nr:hypothetical protein DFH11DRAFT_1134109 [Phellopilus nigrolimitatus]